MNSQQAASCLHVVRREVHGRLGVFSNRHYCKPRRNIVRLHTAVIAGIATALRDIFSLSPAGVGAAVIVASSGTSSGALIVGESGDRCVSRNVRRLVGMLYVIFALGRALARNFTSSRLRRFLAGIVIGGFGSRIDISRRNRTDLRIFCGLDGAAIHRGFFSMPETRGAAPERMREQIRTAGRRVSRRNMRRRGTASTRIRAIKDKENI